MKVQSFLSSMGSLVVLLVVLVLINIVSDRVYAKFDITDNNLYTLSDGTKTILSKLEKEVFVKYYFSQDVESAPLGLKTFGNRVKEILEEYRDFSNGMVNLEVIDPKPDTEDEEWAVKDGIQANRLPTGDSFYMGLAIRPGNESIPLLNPQREEFLEYDITESILRSLSTGKKTIGVMSSLPIVGSQFQFPIPGQPEPTQDWTFIRELKKNYEVRKIELNTVEVPALDMLLVVHPKNLTENTMYAIDQYVMNGGKLMVFVDPSSQGDESQDRDRSSNLGKLFTKWGIKYQPQMMVADVNSATRVNTQRGVIDYPIWLNLDGSRMSRDNVSVADLESIMMIEAGSVNKIEGVTVTFEPLMQASNESSLLLAPAINRNDPQSIYRDLKPGKEPQTLAAIYSAVFSSAFDKKPEPASEVNDSENSNTATYSRPHKQQADSELSILVVADTDMLMDKYSVRTLNFFGQTLATPLNHNLSFVQNAVEYLSGSQDLISIRSRGKFSRPFTLVQDIQKAAQQEYSSKEKLLSERLEEVQQKINQLQNHEVQGNKVILSREQIREIEDFRKEEAKIRGERRLVRKVLREDIERLGQKLTFLNVFLVPLIVAIYGTFRIIRHNRIGGR